MMQIGIAIPQTHPDGQRIERYLRRAEALGFDAAWTIEQVVGTMPISEAVVTLAHAAAVTRRMSLGVSVLLAAQREPVHLAKMLSSIDVLSNGRLIVGVGLGQSSRLYGAFGLDDRGRAARFEQNLEIMRRLWTEPRVTYEGRFARLRNVAMEPKPQRCPPIWFGGHAAPALRRAVERGDGFMGAGSTPTGVFLDELATVRSMVGARRDFVIAKRLYVSCDDDLPAIRAWFGAFYGAPDLADKVAVWGSAQAVADAVRRLRDAGVNHVLLHTVTREEHQLECLAAQVLSQR